MTLVVRHGNRYFSDSKVQLLNQPFFTTDKIRAVGSPFQVVHKGLKIKDYIHAYTYTGAEGPAIKLMTALLDEPDLAVAETMFGISSNLGLINEENHFEVMLIGEKADYSIAVGFERAVVEVYPHNNPDKDWSMGSGGSEYREVKKRYKGIDPIRAMYLAFTLELNSGGAIHVWELFSKPFVHFRRMGMCNKISGLLSDTMRDIVAKGTLRIPYQYDLVSNPDKPPQRPIKRPTPQQKLKVMERQLKALTAQQALTETKLAELKEANPEVFQNPRKRKKKP